MMIRHCSNSSCDIRCLDSDTRLKPGCACSDLGQFADSLLQTWLSFMFCFLSLSSPQASEE